MTQKAKKITLSFQIDKELLEKFDQKVTEENSTRSEVLRQCIMTFINPKKQMQNWAGKHIKKYRHPITLQTHLD